MAQSIHNSVFGQLGLILLSILVSIVEGCGGTGGKAQAQNAAEVSGGSSGGTEPNSSGTIGIGKGGATHGAGRMQVIGRGTNDCGTSNGVGLQMLPDQVGLTTFSFPGSAECEPLSMTLLLKNSDTESIEVQGLSIRPADLWVNAQLPARLNAGATLPVAVDYTGTSTDGAEGTLTVSTSIGCFDFRVRGLAATERLMTYTDRAIDFGEVEAGATSDPHEVSVLFQFDGKLAPPTVEGFSASPEDHFEVVTSPRVTQPVSCEPMHGTVRFKAPPVAGKFEGALTWRVLTESPEGTAEGTVFIPLYGTSR